MVIVSMAMHVEDRHGVGMGCKRELSTLTPAHLDVELERLLKYQARHVATREIVRSLPKIRLT
jgi:hypothetical protein